MSGRRLVPNSRTDSRGVRAGRGGSGREFTPFAGQGFRLGVDPTTTAAVATEVTPTVDAVATEVTPTPTVEFPPRPRERRVTSPPIPRSWEQGPSSSSTGESSGAPRPTVHVEAVVDLSEVSDSDKDNREMLIDEAGIEFDELGTVPDVLEKLEQVRTVSAAWSMEIPEHKYTTAAREELTDFVSEVTMVISELEQVQFVSTTIMQLKIGAVIRKFAELRTNTAPLRMPSSQETSSESEDGAASSSQAVRAPKRRRTTKSKE
jgi:hypothetical protein